MPPQRYTAYRLRGIPAGSSKKDVENLASRALLCDGATIRVESLASDLSRSGEAVAILNIANPPESLSSSNGTEEWILQVSLDDDVDGELILVFDTHFHGCTTLHCPSTQDWKFE